MMKKISILTGTFLLALALSAQIQGQPKLLKSAPDYTQISQSNGLWTFYLYPNQVIAATFIPNRSERDEQISDAVIAMRIKQKPTISRQKDKITLRWGTTSASIDDSSIHFQLANQQQVQLLRTNYSDSVRGMDFKLQKSEMIFGTGSRSLPLNRRGYSLPLHNNPWYGYSLDADALNYSVPVVLSSERYGLFIDNPSSAQLDIGKTNPDELQYRTNSGRLSFYLVPGRQFSDILTRLHALVGTQTLPPRWAMGNFMSRFGYSSEKQTNDILQQMEKDSIPVDAIILDLFWFGDSIKQTMGNLDWVNKKAWPDPAAMIKGWKKKNIQTILITEPFVLKQSRNYEASKSFHATHKNGRPYVLTDFYFGDGGLIDIFRRDACDWFYSKYKTQMDLGVEGWWGDLGEPEKHPQDMAHNLQSMGYYRNFMANEVHNLYGHKWSRMLYERFTKDYPNRRMFHLNRSGYVGTPRFGSFPWSGDVSRSWDGLKGQIPLILGMTMSGVPYMHSDAGGFAGGDGDDELFVRWLQFAAFTPIFRPHGTALGEIEPSVKNIPSEAALWPEPTKSLAKAAVQTRYDWLPYNYTLSYEHNRYGKPLMSPMFFLNTPDSNLYKANAQYLWGEQVMVVPVTDKGQQVKTYYIPAGKWTNLYNHQVLTGPVWFTDSNISIKNIPVYAKEGSFIPKVGGMLNTNDYKNKELTVTYIPSSKASAFTLYEDDGHDARALQKKQFELISFSSSGEGKSLLFQVSSNGGKYPGMPASRKMTLLIPQIDASPVKVILDGKQIPVMQAWNSSTRTISIPFEFRHTKTVMQIIF